MILESLLGSNVRILLYSRIFEMAGGGAENYAFRLSTDLKERGHEISVVADRASEVPGISVYRSPVDISLITKRVKPDISLDWNFKHQADIYRLGGGVHKSFLKYSVNAYPAGLKWIKKIRNRSSRNRAVIRTQDKILQRQNSFFLANSRFAASQAISAGAPPESVGVLHNGVNTKLFHPESDTKKLLPLRQKWGVTERDVVVLFIAHNLVLKNYSMIRQIFVNIARSCPDVKLVIIGKNRPKSLPPNCIYAGFNENMAACYQAADCLIHPTYFDSCSNVVLEAMSSGITVLVSDVCGSNELIQDGRSGFVLPVTGSKEDVLHTWQEQLKNIVTDEKLRINTGSCARNYMLNNDFTQYVIRFELILQRVHKSKSSGGQIVALE